MSIGDTNGYCNTEDVREAMQEVSAGFGNTDSSLAEGTVEAAIYGASRWLATRSRSHWYDSNKSASDVIANAARSATGMELDVPSSPHRQDGQLFRHADDTRTQVTYPNTTAGPYVKVRLPRYHVESIDRLAVRDLGGEQTDWVADADITQGRGEDYYLQVDGASEYGRSYLYLHAGAIGPRKDFGNLLEVDVTYGRDWQDQPWTGVRRGIAALAGAQLFTDSDLQTLIPDDGQLIGVDTKAQQLVKQAFGFGTGENGGDGMGGYLGPVLETPVA